VTRALSIFRALPNCLRSASARLASSAALAAARSRSCARRFGPMEVGGHGGGEAVHETLWGTVAGAWEAGERAADAAIKRLGKK
jgi:hypothetical protein